MAVKLEVFCDFKVHCPTCRSKSYEGHGWRSSTREYLDPKPETDDWECPRGLPWAEGIEPVALTAEQIAAEEVRKRDLSEKLAAAGRAHWLLAHTTLHWTPATFQAWREGIPGYGCSCRKDADEYIAAHPPPLDDGEAMMIWFVEFHDAVNLKLSKPLFGLPAARAKYGR